MILWMWSFVKYPEAWVCDLRPPHDHHRPQITLDIAVVGGTEHCDHLVLVTPGVPLHHALVTPHDELDAVGVEEVLGDVRPPHHRHAAHIV